MRGGADSTPSSLRRTIPELPRRWRRPNLQGRFRLVGVAAKGVNWYKGAERDVVLGSVYERQFASH